MEPGKHNNAMVKMVQATGKNLEEKNRLRKAGIRPKDKAKIWSNHSFDTQENSRMRGTPDRSDDR